MPARDRNAYIGDINALRIAEWLVKAGCAVNSITDSDYGFDLQVQLPDSYADYLAAVNQPKGSWEMSAYVVLVQAKGGDQVEAVRLTNDRWRYLLTAAVPAYLAAANDDQFWIQPVERLITLEELSRRETQYAYKSFAARGGELERLEHGGFVDDALIRASLGTPQLRRWAQRFLPQWNGVMVPDDVVRMIDRLAIYDLAAGGPRRIEHSDWRDRRNALLEGLPPTAREQLSAEVDDENVQDLVDRESSFWEFTPETIGDAHVLSLLPESMTVEALVAVAATSLEVVPDDTE
jgi:hypothetical protein